MENFKQKFIQIFCVEIYVKVQSLMQFSLNATKLCHATVMQQLSIYDYACLNIITMAIKTHHTIQIVTDVKVIIENCLLEVNKMFPRGRKLR